MPADGRQEVAVLQGGPRRVQVLREAHPPREEPFKKACGSDLPRRRGVPPVRALHLAASRGRRAAAEPSPPAPASPPRRRLRSSCCPRRPGSGHRWRAPAPPRREPARGVAAAVLPQVCSLPRSLHTAAIALPGRRRWLRLRAIQGASGSGAQAAALPRARGRPEPRQAAGRHRRRLRGRGEATAAFLRRVAAGERRHEAVVVGGGGGRDAALHLHPRGLALRPRCLRCRAIPQR